MTKPKRLHKEIEGKRKEADYAEIPVDRLLMESFANESSPYFKHFEDILFDEKCRKLRAKLKWHVARSLSPRQKQVISLYLLGKKQREIASILGVTQQVVSIYKQRAINRLRELIKE